MSRCGFRSKSKRVSTQPNPTHYTLHTTRYTLHTTHYILHPTPYTLHTTLYTPHTTPYTLHPIQPEINNLNRWISSKIKERPGEDEWSVLEVEVFPRLEVVGIGQILEPQTL